MGRYRTTAFALLAAPLAVGACSIASGPYVFSESQKDIRSSICENARVNMMAATNPIEIRRWEIYMEDYNCPTLREVMDDPGLIRN